MSNTELLLKEVEGLPPDSMGEILAFVGHLKHKASPKQGLGKKPLLAQTVEKHPLTFAEAQQKIRALGVDLSVDRMLRQKHDDLAQELARETRGID